MAMVDELLRYLGSDCHLVAQPIHRLPDLRCRSVEVLLRDRTGRFPTRVHDWCTADRACRLALDHWVLHETLNRLMDQVPSDLDVSINLSQESVMDGAGLAWLEAAQLPVTRRRRLWVELAEAAMEQVDERELARQMQALRRYGVRLALDDFGNGACGLRYLLTLPHDRLKLDLSLTQALTRCDAMRDELLGQMFELLRSRGVDIVAEGVETATQLQACIAAGCTAVQGFLLGRGVRPTELALLPRWRIEEGVLRREGDLLMVDVGDVRVPVTLPLRERLRAEALAGGPRHWVSEVDPERAARWVH